MTEIGWRLRGKAIEGIVLANLLCVLGALCVRALKQNLTLLVLVSAPCHSGTRCLPLPGSTGPGRQMWQRTCLKQSSFSSEGMAGFGVKKTCVHQNPPVFFLANPLKRSTEKKLKTRHV